MITRYDVEGFLKAALAICFGLSLAAIIISAFNQGQHYAPTTSLLSCSLKDGSSVTADSFVIRDNLISLQIAGGRMLLPYDQIHNCIEVK